MRATRMRCTDMATRSFDALILFLALGITLIASAVLPPLLGAVFIGLQCGFVMWWVYRWQAGR